MLFRSLRKKVKNNIIASEKCISYFPVTPSIFSENTIYSEPNMVKDLRTLVTILNNFQNNGINIKLKIKIKREVSKMHSQKYVKLINDFSSQYKWIDFINPKSEIIKELRSSELVVCSPFTTVALMAKYLEKKVIYFSTAKNYFMKKTHENISVVTDEKKLIKIIKKII